MPTDAAAGPDRRPSVTNFNRFTVVMKLICFAKMNLNFVE